MTIAIIGALPPDVSADRHARQVRPRPTVAPAWPSWSASVLLHLGGLVIGIAFALTRTPPVPLPRDEIPVTLVFEAAAPTSPPIATAEPPAPKTALPELPSLPSLPPPPAQLPEIAAPPEPILPTPPALDLSEAPPLPPQPAPSPAPPVRAPAKPPPPRPPAVPRAQTPPLSSPAHSATANPQAPSSPPAAAVANQQAAAPLIPPRLLGGAAANRKPDYPLVARSNRQQGRVLLRVHVSAAGAVGPVDIVASSGHPLLDQAARAAIQTWHFAPASRAGTALPGQVDVPIEFRMDD